MSCSVVELNEDGALSMFCNMLDLTLMTAASNADVTYFRLSSISRLTGLCAEGELADSVKLPCFSTLIAPIGLLVGERISEDWDWLEALLLCMLNALIFELKFSSISDGVYKC